MNYTSHKLFTQDVTGTLYLRLARLPQTSQFISHFYLFKHQPELLDLGLGDASEYYTFEPLQAGNATGHNMFRIHNGDDLEPEIVINATTYNANSGMSGSAFMEYTASRYVIETSLNPEGYMEIGSDLLISNSSEVLHNSCLLTFDQNQVLLNQRTVSHKPGSFASLFGRTAWMSGTINETLTCRDFMFRDTILVTHSGGSESYFSEEMVPYLDVLYSNGNEYGGMLSFVGKLILLHSAVRDEKVFRLFNIAGSADLDPTSQTYEYMTPAGEIHLVAACYDSDGHVLWHRMLSKVSSEMSNPGRFLGRIIMLSSSPAIEYCYIANLNDGLSSGTFHAMLDEDLLESGEMFAESSSRYSPRYIYTFEGETGNAVSLYSARQEGSPENFARNNSFMDVAFVESDIVSFSQLHGSYQESVTNFRSHYPTVDSVVVDQGPTTDYSQELLLVNVGDFNDSEHFFVSADNGTGNGFFMPFSVSKKDDLNYMLTGSVGNGGLTFPFVNDTIFVPFFGVSEIRKALILFVEKMVLSVQDEQKKDFNIFPNPASEYILISENVETPLSYQVTDLSGKQVKSGILNQDRAIDLSGLPAGMYILNFLQAGYTGHKFVKY